MLSNVLLQVVRAISSILYLFRAFDFSSLRLLGIGVSFLSLGKPLSKMLRKMVEAK